MAYTYSKLATVTVGSVEPSSINFISIPQNYTDLVILFSGRVNYAQESRAVKITFNNNSSNKKSQTIYSTNTVPGAASYGSEIWVVDGVPGTSTGSVKFGNYMAYITNYTSSNYKSISIDSAPEGNTTTMTIGFAGGLWSNSSPITEISLQPENGNLMQYTTATLYGIKAEV